ncbi:hypothetical protein J3E74DRAFT_329352 [Bipolaris maydis]|nr:hypothetical protein J3E74DRAFT_329352 [Bipolaris maydis]
MASSLRWSSTSMRFSIDLRDVSSSARRSVRVRRWRVKFSYCSNAFLLTWAKLLRAWLTLVSSLLTFMVSHFVYFRFTSSGRVPKSLISRFTSASRSVRRLRSESFLDIACSCLAIIFASWRLLASFSFLAFSSSLSCARMSSI